MDIHILLLGCSSKQGDLDNLRNFLNQVHEEPSYLFFLFEQIQTQEVQQNETLFLLTALEIKSVILEKYSSRKNFFSKEILDQIPQQILGLVTTISPNNSTVIEVLIECFRFLFKNRLGKNSQIIHNVIDLYSTFGTTNENLFILLKITYLWAKEISKETQGHGQNEKYGEIFQSLSSSLLEKLSILTEAAVPHILTDFNACNIITYIAKSASKLMSCITQPQYCNSFDIIITHLSNSLLIQIPSETPPNHPIFYCKRSSSHFFEHLIRIFSTEYSIKPESRAFSDHFYSELLPDILKAILECSAQSNDFTTKYHLITCFNLLLHIKDVGQNFVNPDFVKNFVIPSASFSETDINEMDNPEYFISINYEHYNADSPIPRTVSSQLIGKLVFNYSAYEMVYPLLTTLSDDPIDTEAKLFLLTKYSKALRNYQKKFKNISDPDSVIDPDFILSVTGLINPSTPSFLIATALDFLSYTIIHCDDEAISLGIQIAISILQAEISPVLSFFASKLLWKCSKKSSDDMLNMINKDEIIPLLMELVSETNMSIPVYAIKALSTDLSFEQKVSLISFLLQNTRSSLEAIAAENDSSNDSYTPNLKLIYNLLNEIDDVEQITQLSLEVVPIILSLLQDFPFILLDLLINICSVFTTKLVTNEIPEIVLQSLPLFLQFIASQGEDDQFSDHISSFAHFISPLLLNPNNYIGAEPEMLKSIKQLLLSAFQQHFEERFQSYSSSTMNSQDVIDGFILMGTFIQVFGPEHFDFLQFAKNIIDLWRRKQMKDYQEYCEEEENNSETDINDFDPIDDEDDDSISLLCSVAFILASSFNIDPSSTLTALTQDDIAFLAHALTNDRCKTKFESKNFIIVLLHLSNTGNFEAYQNASEIFAALEESNDDNSDNDNDNDDEEGDDDDDNDDDDNDDEDNDNDDDDDDNDDEDNDDEDNDDEEEEDDDDNDDDEDDPFKLDHNIINDTDSEGEDDEFIQDAIENEVQFPISTVDYKALYNHISSSTYFFASLNPELQEKLAIILSK